MMQMSNEELLRRYDKELVLKIRNNRNLKYDRKLLERFMDCLERLDIEQNKQLYL